METLDHWLTEHAIDRVDLIKMDVEGAELNVLQGADALLGRADAPLILYESVLANTAGLAYHPVEIVWLLEGYGYSVSWLDRGRVVPRPPGHYEGDFVAWKPHHRQDLGIAGETVR
jgi:hypothetical protein